MRREPTTHADRTPAAIMWLAWLVVLGLTCWPMGGCSGVPDAPSTTVAKVHAWWKTICAGGDATLDAAETMTRGPVADAGAGDASASADNDGGTDR